jgi:uncharacterized protein (DUF1330 family)
MSAYLIGNVEIRDADAIAELPLVEKFGGKALVIDGAAEFFEGNWRPRNMILLEFPSVEAIQGLLSSPEYAPLAAMRRDNAHTDLVAFGAG